MQPVYCIVCRQHIPKLVSNAGKGICPQCVEIAKAVAAATATTQAQSNIQTENETKMDCDQSTDTIEVELESQNNATLVRFYKIDWFLIAWVALTALVFIGSIYSAQKRHEYERHFVIDTEIQSEPKYTHWLCEYCGKTWNFEESVGKPLQYQLGRCDGISIGIHSLLNRY
jgi:hypothetical protein